VQLEMALQFGGKLALAAVAAEESAKSQKPSA